MSMDSSPTIAPLAWQGGPWDSAKVRAQNEAWRSYRPDYRETDRQRAQVRAQANALFDRAIATLSKENRDFIIANRGALS